jgi:hypothetical protein
MGDAASAALVGACAGVAFISLAVGYLAELVVPVSTKPAPPPPEILVSKEKTLEERVEIIEKKEGIAPPAPSAPPANDLPPPPSAPPADDVPPPPSAPPAEPPVTPFQTSQQVIDTLKSENLAENLQREDALERERERQQQNTQARLLQRTRKRRLRDIQRSDVDANIDALHAEVDSNVANVNAVRERERERQAAKLQEQLRQRGNLSVVG